MSLPFTLKKVPVGVFEMKSFFVVLETRPLQMQEQKAPESSWTNHDLENRELSSDPTLTAKVA